MLCAVRKRWNVAQRKPTNGRQLSGRSRSHLRRRSRRTLPKRESACMEVLGIASSSDAKESYPDDLQSYLTEAMHGDMHWELREAFGFRCGRCGSNSKPCTFLDIARWIESSSFKTHEKFSSRHQLLRNGTHQAAHEQRPRRNRNELCNSGSAEQPENAHGSRIG